MSIILSCEGLYKTYGVGSVAVEALKPTTLSFEKGQFCVILGRSGSGKSTLLHLLGGLDIPSGGGVFVEGIEYNIHDMNCDELSVLRRRRFGFVFQFFNLMQDLTAWENILLPLALDGRKPDQDYLKELIKTLGVGDRMDHLPGALSGGEQQRVAIARAMAIQPDILFADEPTGNLDSGNAKQVINLLHTAGKKWNRTVIMVTHDASVEPYADRVITLMDGCVKEDLA